MRLTIVLIISSLLISSVIQCKSLRNHKTMIKSENTSDIYIPEAIKDEIKQRENPFSKKIKEDLKDIQDYTSLVQYGENLFKTASYWTHDNKACFDSCKSWYGQAVAYYAWNRYVCLEVQFMSNSHYYWNQYPVVALPWDLKNYGCTSN